MLIPVLVSFINILMNRIGGARNCVYPFQVRIGLAGHVRRRVCATQGRGVLTRRLRRIWTVLECRRCWNIGGVGMCGWRCCPVFRHTVSLVYCVHSRLPPSSQHYCLCMWVALLSRLLAHSIWYTMCILVSCLLLNTIVCACGWWKWSGGV